MRRLGIGKRITVGSGKDDQNSIPFVHRLTSKYSGSAYESSCILGGRIKPQDFFNDITDQIWFGLEPLTHVRVGSKCNEGVSDQTGRCFIRLRKKAYAVCYDDVLAFISEPRDAADEAFEYSAAARIGMQFAKESLELAGSRRSALDFFIAGEWCQTKHKLLDKMSYAPGGAI